MTAYMRQPSGHVPIDILEAIAMKRFKALRALENNSRVPVEDLHLDIFITDGRLDVYSHFILRLASALTPANLGTGLRRFVAKGESLLWWHRVSKATPSMLRTLHGNLRWEAALEGQRLKQDLSKLAEKLPKIRDHLDRYLRFLEGFETFLRLTENWHADHEITVETTSDCGHHYVEVSWQLVKKLVTTHQVELAKGKATLTCDLLLPAILAGFEENLSLATQSLILCGVRGPEPMWRLAKAMAVTCQQPANVTRELKACHLSQVTETFPPCMKWSFDKMLQDHNCHHNTRFQLTLFLKSIGMTVEEQIKFWRTEYSKPAPTLGNQPKWSERRHTYSISHVYGLRGNMVPQEGWSCARIQAETSQGPGPVCPFKLEARAIVERLPVILNNRKDDVANIVEAAAVGSPGAACATCLQACKRAANPTTNIMYPQEYFLKFQNLLEW